MEIKAFIFDFDGVIVDSEHAQFKAIRHMFKRININYSKHDHIMLLGYGLKGIIRFMLDKYRVRYNNKTIKYLIRVKESYYNKLLTKIKFMPGALQLINKAKKKGYKVALASSSLLEEIHNILKPNILKLFDVIISGDMVSKTKPDPEIYELAIMKLSLKPKQCLVFEDSYAGYLAAIQANAYCIVIPNKYIKQKLKDDAMIKSKFKKALYMLNSLNKFRFSMIENRKQKNIFYSNK